MSSNRLPEPTTRSFILQNIEIWSAEKPPYLGSLWVHEGIVRSVSETPQLETSEGAPSIFDLSGYALIPSGVDPQVHLRVPGQSQKEIASTGLQAARAGGISAILTMPNTKPVIDSVEALNQGRTELGDWPSQTGVQVLWSASITRGMLGRECVDFDRLAEAGVSAFTDDGLGVESDDRMREAFAASERLGLPILQHAEFSGHGGVLAPGPTQEHLKIPAYSDEPEWKMVQRDLSLLADYPKARYHVLHVSSARTLELIREAKAKGLPVTAEVTPHHLFFTSADIPEGNSSFKMNPPLRSETDRKALWAALKDGTLNFVATDHAPHEARMKGAAYREAAFGTTGLETSLRVLLWGVQHEGLSPQRLVEVFSSRPAAFLKVPQTSLGLTPGTPFKGVFADLTAPKQEVILDDLYSLSKNSCFLGSVLPKITSIFM